MDATYRAPVIRLDWWDGDSWEDMATSYGLYLLSFNIRRGKQTTLDSFEPGTATFRLSDPSRTYTALATDTPVRLVADWDGDTDIPIWHGLMDERFSSEGGGQRQYLVGTATDWMGWANRREMPNSQWSTLLIANGPDYWWPGQTNASSETRAGTVDWTAWDYGPSQADMIAAVSDGYRGDPIAVNSTQQSIALPTDARMKTSEFVGIDEVDVFTIAFAFTCEATAGNDRNLFIGRSTSATGNVRWRIFINDSDGNMTAEMRASDGTTVVGTIATSNPAAGRYDDEEPHVAIVRFYSDNGANHYIGIFTDLDHVQSADVTSTPAGSGGFIVTGSASVTQSPCKLADIAYYNKSFIPDSTTSAFTPEELLPFADASQTLGLDAGLWADDDTQERFDHLMAAAEATVTEQMHISGAWVWLGLTIKDTLGDHLQTLGNSFLGAAYMLRDGTLRIRDFDALADAGNAAHYATVQCYLTDEDTPGGTPAVRYSRPAPSTPRADLICNHLDVRTGTGYSDQRNYTAIDRTSQGLYGVKRVTVTTDAVINDLDDITDAMEAYLDLHSTPVPDVGTITIQPFDSETATDFVLNNLELEKVVAYHESDWDENEIVDGNYRVIAEEWDWADGLSWSVRLTLTAV